MIRVNQANYDAAQVYIRESGFKIDPDLGEIYRRDGTPIRAALNTWGYRRFRFGKIGVLHHRVIWESVHGPVPPEMFINHIDGDKTNNAIDNLECVTHDDNMRHARESRLIDHGPQFENRERVCAIYRDAWSSLTARQVAEKYGTKVSYVRSVKYGLTRAEWTADLTTPGRAAGR